MMFISWIYKQPVEMIFGIGEIISLPERLLSANKPFVVTSNFFLSRRI